MLADAESVPTPPASTSGQPPQEDEEIEIDISSSTVRLFAGRLYLALPNVRPPGLKEDEISDLIQHLETDLKAALGKIKAKSHRKPWKESSLIINMRMSGALEDGATKVKLKPCIWLFCGSRWCRKIIEKDVKKLNWRLPCGIQIVDKGGPLLAASEDSDEGYADDDPSEDDDSTCLAGFFNVSHSMPAFAPGHPHCATGLDTTRGSEHGENISSAVLSPSGSHRLEEQENILAWRAPLSPPNSVSAAPLSSSKSVGSGASSTPALPSRKNVVTYAIHRSGRSSNSRHDLETRNVYLSGPGCRAMRRRSRASFSDSEHVAETNLKLLDDMILEFYVQESPTNSAIGLVCRSTIRTQRAIVSERFSRMGGVITVTRGLETTLYGVTSGHSLICQILEDAPSGTDDSRRSFDESSDISNSSGDSSSDDMSKDNRSHGHDPPPPYETTKKWINASQGLVATFVGLHADSRQFGMIPRETSVKSGRMVGDLALIKLPKHCARRLQNQFVEPVKPRDNSPQEKGLNPPVIEADDGENELFVLLSKTRSVAGSRVTGTFHFSVGGRKLETERIMLSEDLGEYRNNVLAQMSLLVLISDVPRTWVFRRMGGRKRYPLWNGYRSRSHGALRFDLTSEADVFRYKEDVPGRN